jgi:hypothetical protein
MDTPNELPPPTRKTPLPYVTIVGATAGLLFPLAAIATLFWATRSAPTQDSLSAEQKLRKLQASEERQMTTYGWIDKPTGVAHIPVARAKELILKDKGKTP